MNVVLPDPDGPINATKSLGARASDAPRTASTPFAPAYVRTMRVGFEDGLRHGRSRSSAAGGPRPGMTSASSSASPRAATASSGSRTRPSLPTGSTASPSCRIRPSRTRMRRSARRAAVRSCVTITIVTPNSRFTARNDSSTRSAETESSSAVGSSASSSIGVFESATAIAARCCSPPESCPTLWFARSARSTSVRSSSAPRRRSDASPECSTPGSRTFSRTDRYGTRFRAVPCHTNPTRWARYVVSASSLRSPRSCPSTSTTPADARSRPPRRFRIVDLPAPLGPTTARNSPRGTSRSTPPSATTPVSPIR